MTKLNQLIDYLGDMKEYTKTGLYFDTKEQTWNSVWVNSIYKIEDFEKLPKPIDTCHCSTEVRYNYLIMHTQSGRLEYVGSECINRFGNPYKRCIDCHERNKCKTKRCASCRKYCDYHKEFHDDNEVHTKSSQERYRLKFGKYRGYSIDHLIGIDDYYLQWLVETNYLDCYLSLYVCSIIPKTTVQFGKHKGKSFEWINDNDLEYYQWLKQNIVKPYINFI